MEDDIAGAAAADVEDGRNVALAAHLELQFLVEAEDGAFGAIMVVMVMVHVAGAAATGWESRWHGFAQVVWGSSARGTGCSLRVGDVGVLQRDHVAGAAAAGVDGWAVFGDGRVWLDEEIGF